MSELIDREATVKQICKIGEMVGGHDRDVVISIALFVQDDKTAFPTITIPVAELDTTEVFGEWEHWGSPFTDDTIANSIVCTRCKARYVEIDGEVFNFCPNCGSDNRPRILDEAVDGEGKDGNVKEGEKE